MTYSTIYNQSVEKNRLSYFIGATLLMVLAFYLLCGLVNPYDPEVSLYQSIAIGGIVVFLYTYLLIKEIKWGVAVLAIYLIKCGIGVNHYLSFVDPGYFSNPDTVQLTVVDDFLSMFEQVRAFADNCWDGEASMESMAWGRHPELYWLIAAIFSQIGCFILSIVCVNGVASSMMAVIIGYITKQKSDSYGIALVLAGFFPLTLITSYFTRDIVGMLVATFAIACVILAKRGLWIWLLLSSYLLYLQREIYALVPIAAYFIWSFLKERKNNETKLGILFVGVFAVLAFGSFFSSMIFFENQSGYTSNLDNPLLYILFPIRYFMCIIGPFPWSNTFVSPEKTFYLQEYVMSAAMFYITLRFFPQLYRDFKERKALDYIIIVALLIMVTGIFNNQSRLSYICFAVPLFIPYLAENIYTRGDFIIFHVKYLIYMTIFNIVYICIGVSGTSSIFK